MKYPVATVILGLLLAGIKPVALAEEVSKPGWSVESQAASMLKTLGPAPVMVDPFLLTDDDDSSLRHRAERFLKLIDSAAQGETAHSGSGCNQSQSFDRPGLCILRWRKTDALSEFRAGYQQSMYGLKSRLVGKAMAHHLELDLDSSPEIRLKWEFD
jgi:hypothetical protein